MRNMQIFVKTWDGSTTTVQVCPQDTIGHVKAMVMLRTDGLDRFYVSYAGRPLAEQSKVVDCGIQGLSTLGLGVRLLGGGGDGGATGAESRDCYLNMYAVKKPDKVDPNEVKLAKFTNCTVSSEPLKPPCVIDLLGNLYNKEAVVSALLTKSLPKKLGYIKGLKDLIPIHLTSIPGVNPDADNSGSKFQCPITGQELNGKFKFFALRSCGHVLSARALKEVSSTSCAVCYTPFTETEKIPLNGTEEEVLVLRERMMTEKAKTRDKKEKNVKNGKQERPEEAAATADLSLHSIEKSKLHNGKRKGEIRTAAEEAEVAAARPKGSDYVTVTTKYKASDNLPENATKSVYASIFTSSSKRTFRETYSCRSLPLGRN